MRLLIDECVPASVTRVFQEHGCTTRFVADDLAPKTPDLIVATFANWLSATVVTWNVRHFRKFLTRQDQGRLMFPDMGLIGFQCPEVIGETRLRAFYDLVQAEQVHAANALDKRIKILIGFNEFKVYR